MKFSPPVQQHLDAWVAALDGFGPLLSGGYTPERMSAQRALYVKALAEHPTPAGVEIATVDMDGVPGTLVTPSSVEAGRTMLYMHGGGYVAGSPDAYLVH